jgi:hypothetical protein
LDRAASGVFAETTATTSGVQNAKMETDPIADRATTGTAKGISSK